MQNIIPTITVILIISILVYTGLIIYLRIITINQIKTIDGLKKELLQMIAELTKLTESQPEFLADRQEVKFPNVPPKDRAKRR